MTHEPMVEEPGETTQIRRIRSRKPEVFQSRVLGEIFLPEARGLPDADLWKAFREAAGNRS